ncbi:hypothetical protein D9M68_683080 [compost metagenome]
MHRQSAQLREKALHIAVPLAATRRDHTLRTAQRQALGQARQHPGVGGVDVQGRVLRQRGHQRQQTLVIGLAHLQQQTQLRHVGQLTVGRTVGRLQQQVLIIFSAIAAARLLIGVQPVEQALGVGLVDLQAEQQPTKLPQRRLVDLPLPHQAVEVETPRRILDTHTQLATLVQGEGRLRPRPRLAQMIHAWIALLQIALQYRFAQGFATQGVVPGLAHMQLIGAAANRQLLAGDDPGANHRDHRHHQHHGDQRHAALRLHGEGSTSGSVCSGDSSAGVCSAPSGITSGKRSRRRNSP